MKFKILILIVAFAALLLGAYNFFFEKVRTGYINISELYNEFDFKKELESKLENIKFQRNNLLDSIELKINVLSRAIKEDIKNDSLKEQYNILVENYKLKESQFNSDNNALVEQYTTQIFDQLNQYIEDYGIQNDYDYIFGANNNGSLMFAGDNEDLTKEILEYVNLKYQGKTGN